MVTPRKLGASSFNDLIDAARRNADEVYEYVDELAQPAIPPEDMYKLKAFIVSNLYEIKQCLTELGEIGRKAKAERLTK